MSIDLIVYTSLSPDEVTRRIVPFVESSGELFQTSFLVYPAHRPQPLSQSIAAGFGVLAKAKFSVALNNKAEAHRLPEVARSIRDLLKGSEVVVLFNGETRYPSDGG